MINQDREQKAWREFCAVMQPVADLLVKRIIATTIELGDAKRAIQLLGRAFDLVLGRAKENLFAELNHLNRAAAKPEVLQ